MEPIENGEILLNWLQINRLRSWSSFFAIRVSRFWTWRAPNGLAHNQIDYVFSRSSLNVLDAGVLSAFKFDSDHRIIRTKVQITTQRKFFKQKQIPTVSRDLFKYGISNYAATQNNTAKEIYSNLNSSLRESYDVATCWSRPHPFISQNTIDLLARRQTFQTDPSPIGRIQFTLLSKLARMSRKEDVRKRRESHLRKALDQGYSLNKVMNEGKSANNRIIHLRDNNGILTNDELGLARIIREFYNNLYRDRSSRAAVIAPTNEPLSPFLESEVLHAIQKTTLGTSPGTDRIPPEAVRWGSPVIVSDLTRMFNLILAEGVIPPELLESRTILLFKKGDVTDIGNYRPITLLNTLYKVLSRCLLNRMERHMEENISEEQCGFRKNYGTSDNLHIVRQVMEKCREYRLPTFFCFVDLAKAFDSIHHNSIWSSLGEIGIHPNLISLLKATYEVSSSSIAFNGSKVPVEVKQGVRQGDVISPRLFTIVLDSALKKIDWDKLGHLGLRIGGRRLTHCSLTTVYSLPRINGIFVRC